VDKWTLQFTNMMFGFNKKWIPDPVNVVAAFSFGFDVKWKVIELVRLPLYEPLTQYINNGNFAHIRLVLFCLIV